MSLDLQPPEVSRVERRLLDMYRMREQVKEQIDSRLRTLDTLTRYRPAKDVIRRQLAERRVLLRELGRVIENDEALLARFRLLTAGAPMPLGDLLAEVRPADQEGQD